MDCGGGGWCFITLKEGIDDCVLYLYIGFIRLNDT